MTQIIAFSGKKQSGKGTLCRFLTENAVTLFGDGIRIATYSIATPLKRFCVDVLGLEEAQCFGSDIDKNTLTRYCWEDLPHYQRLVLELHEASFKKGRTTGVWDAVAPPTGLMTARQVLQEVGTGIFRRMWADVWNQACLRAIRKDKPDVALIDDIRFPDEVEAVKTAGGLVIRLTRAPLNDPHASETALDDYWGFSVALDNARLSEAETIQQLREMLVGLKTNHKHS